MNVWSRTYRLAGWVGVALLMAILPVRAVDISGPRATVARSLAENQAYVIPDHTCHLINTNPCQISSTSLTVPGHPVDGQTLMISSFYNIQSLKLNGNGLPIKGNRKIAIRNESGVLYCYSAVVGWVPILSDPFTHCNDTAKSTAHAFGADYTAGGWWFNRPSVSWDFYLGSNRAWMQCTAGGTATTSNYLEFLCQNTLDVKSVAPGNGDFATSGFLATICNSSTNFGPGATNDKQVEAKLTVTGRNLRENSMWPGSLPGAAAWLQYQNGPFYMGDKVLGQRVMFDASGNFALTYAFANTSEYRTTASGGSVTIADNAWLRQDCR